MRDNVDNRRRSPLPPDIRHYPNGPVVARRRRPERSVRAVLRRRLTRLLGIAASCRASFLVRITPRGPPYAPPPRVVASPTATVAGLLGGRLGTVDDDDATLILRSLRSPEDFGHLFRRHQRAVTVFVRGRVPPDLVEDVVAECFVAAFRIRRRYDFNRLDAKPWLFGIAANTSRNSLRKMANASDPPHPGPPQDPIEELIAALTAQERLIAEVAPLLKRGDLLPLRMLAEGYSYEDIAAVTGRSPTALRSFVHRLRRRLNKSATNRGRRDNNR